MHNFIATPMNRSEIRSLATQVRMQFGFAKTLRFPIMEFVELALPQIDKHYSFEVPEIHELGQSHGLTVREGDHVTIQIRADVYDLACLDAGRDRGTVAHELGHYLMHARSPTLHRHFGGSIRAFEDPEWQAKCFQSELLVPKHLVAGMRDDEVATACGVSLQAAEYQMKLYRSGK
jgi:Zn-dependent peptidase ImmA (M78 family)